MAMNIKENRDRFYWLLSSFANRVRDNPDTCNADLVNGFLNNEIAMEDGWKEYMKAVEDCHKKNVRLLKAIKSVKGKTFYRRLCELIKDCEGLKDCVLARIVREPNGQYVKESYGKQIAGYWVNQWSVGAEGDSFEGTICVEIKPGRYFKFDYST
jgi:hypothetical protein